MKFVLIAVLAILVVAMFSRRGLVATAIAGDNKIVVGGVYATQKPDGNFRISKILVAEDGAVHVRYYKETPTEVPRTIDTHNLSIAIGHAPLSREGWLKERRVLISTEKVAESELEGYKIYLENQ